MGAIFSITGLLGLLAIAVIAIIKKIRKKPKSNILLILTLILGTMFIVAVLMNVTTVPETEYNELLGKYESLKSEYDKIVEERDHLLEKEVQKKELNTIIKKEITFNNGATSNFNVYEEDGIIKGLIYCKLKGASAEEDMNQVYALMYGMALLEVENYSLKASSDHNKDTLIFLTCTDGEYLVPICPETYRQVNVTTNTEEAKIVVDALSIKTQLP